MKRDMENLNLRDAFKQEPDFCHEALMHAACSVKEEKQVKRTSFKAVIIAAIVIVSMVTVAFAATNAGLFAWFTDAYNTTIPQSAQDVLSATEQKSYEVGPLTFTVNETLADGHIAYLTVTAKTTDGSPAVLYMGNADPADPVGSQLAAQLNHSEITAETPLCEAASLAGISLYNVMAWMQVDGEVLVGEEMMDAMIQDDGSILLIDMVQTDAAKVGTELKAEVVLRAYEMNPETLEIKGGEPWEVVESRPLKVNGVMAEKSYKPEGSAQLTENVTVTGVKAEQTCAGVYVTVCADVADGFTLEDVIGDVANIALQDSTGKAFPTGLNLSVELLDGEGKAFEGADPADIAVDDVQIRLLISVDQLPESLMIVGSSGNVAVK